jgi:hypothetical protein
MLFFEYLNMPKYRLAMVIAYVMFFISSRALGQTLVGIDKEEMNTIMRQVHVDYLPTAQVDSGGKPYLTVDATQSFKLVKPGLSDRYMIAITYVPRYSKIENMETQCELATYSEKRKYISTILSVGLSDYGVCEGFDAIGFVRNKKHIITGVGVIVDMAYGPSAIERKTPFFIKWDKHASIPVTDDEISRRLQNTRGVDSLYGIEQVLK